MKKVTELSQEQLKTLTIWAYDRLWDIVDDGTYDGDCWFTVDESIPELQGKIDVNIWNDDDDHVVKGCAYNIDTLSDGTINTNTSCWVRLF